MAEIDDEVDAPLPPARLGVGVGVGMGDRAGGSGGSGEVVVTTPSRVVFTSPPARHDGPLFDHERLDVFRFARDFFVMTKPWRKRKLPHNVKEQFETSVLSIVSNIAEGAGKTAKADKRRFYEMAKGSTTEAAAQLEVIHLLEVIDDEEYASGRQQLLRIARMLSGLCGAPRTTGR